MQEESQLPASSARLRRLRVQTRVLRWCNGFLLAVLGLAIGCLAIASALPQQRERAEKERQLERIQEKERRILVRKQDMEAAYKALREDPEYLELHARDRLNLHLPGETIYRIERSR